jgi:CNT family concentrative nucleoside transporter
VLHGILGSAALLIVAYGISENRTEIPWRTVLAGIALQWLLAVVLIGFPPAQSLILLLNDGADALQRATDTGTGFVFGYLGGGALPFAESYPGASFILAFKALPLVLVISALSAVLFHWGILQKITAAFAFVLRRIMGVGGALALGAAVHIFVGMIEAPLLVRPYLARMQRGELFALMTCGMAGVAGTVMVIYAGFLAPILPNALGNILIASVISTPAGLAVAALMVPFHAALDETSKIVLPHPSSSTMDAVVRGTADGIPVLVGIIATLLVTITFVTLINMALGQLPDIHGGAISLQRIAALPFRPVMWLIGIPWPETAIAAHLMATKTVLNEFVAYLNLASLPTGDLAARSRLILTYALCGFANFGSLGILIGGLGIMVPERRAEIVGLGLRAILSGTIATCLSGAVIGALIS